MEFWGVEVKPGETIKYEVNDSKYLHLSQATLGEGKKESKANESATIYVKFGDKKLVIGTLSADKVPQISYDLVFEKGFELSHTWKNGSVFFVGYKVASEGSDDLSEDTDSEFENEVSPVAKELKESKDKQAEARANLGKNVSLSSKSDAGASELKKGKEEEDDSDDDDDDFDDDSDEGESDDDEDMLDGAGDSDEDDEEESSEEEATPKKGDLKKRAAGSASKTPVAEKKAKVVSPPQSGQKTGGAEGKKGGSHPGTPYPTKKTPAGGDKTKQQQTPKSGGPVACPSCPKTFKDENALKSHSQAKHPAQ